jgi:hypothetical protein
MSQTISLAWREFRANFRSLATLFCGLYAAACLIRLGLNFNVDLVAILALIVVPSTFGAVAVLIAAPIVTDHLAGIETTVSESIRSVAPRLKTVWGLLMINMALTILVAFTLRLGAVLLVPLFYGPLFFTPLFHGPPILAQIVGVEKETLRGSLRRFRFLVAGYGLRVFFYLFVPALVVGMFLLMILISFAQAIADGPQLPALLGFVAVQGILMGLGAAFLSCMQTVSYLGLRAEKEDFDHDALLEERAAVSSTAVPTPD